MSENKSASAPQHVTRLITLEEHFIVPAVNERHNAIWKSQPHTPAECEGMEFMNEFAQKSPVMNFSDRRLEYLDEGGIDVQVLSYGNSSPMTLRTHPRITVTLRPHGQSMQYP